MADNPSSAKERVREKCRESMDRIIKLDQKLLRVPSSLLIGLLGAIIFFGLCKLGAVTAVLEWSSFWPANGFIVGAVFHLSPLQNTILIILLPFANILHNLGKKRSLVFSTYLTLTSLVQIATIYFILRAMASKRSLMNLTNLRAAAAIIVATTVGSIVGSAATTPVMIMADSFKHSPQADINSTADADIGFAARFLANVTSFGIGHLAVIPFILSLGMWRDTYHILHGRPWRFAIICSALSGIILFEVGLPLLPLDGIILTSQTSFFFSHTLSLPLILVCGSIADTVGFTFSTLILCVTAVLGALFPALKERDEDLDNRMNAQQVVISKMFRFQILLVVILVSNLSFLVIDHAKKAALADLVKANQQKIEFMAFLCHELRNPLHAILNATEFISDEEKDSEHAKGKNAGSDGPAMNRQSFLSVIHTAASYMAQVIHNVLDTAKLESGDIKLDPKPCDFVALVKRIEKEARSVMRSQDVGLWIEINGTRLTCAHNDVSAENPHVFEELARIPFLFSPQNNKRSDNILSGGPSGAGAGFRHIRLSGSSCRQNMKVLVDETRFTQLLVNVLAHAIKSSPSGKLVTCRIKYEDPSLSRTEPSTEASSETTSGWRRLWSCWSLVSQLRQPKLSIGRVRRAADSESWDSCNVEIEVVDASDMRSVPDPTAFLKRLFDPFSMAFFGEPQDYGGTGLGLVISKKIAELMGGTIEASLPTEDVEDVSRRKMWFWSWRRSGEELDDVELGERGNDGVKFTIKVPVLFDTGVHSPLEEDVEVIVREAGKASSMKSEPSKLEADMTSMDHPRILSYQPATCSSPIKSYCEERTGHLKPVTHSNSQAAACNIDIPPIVFPKQPSVANIAPHPSPPQPPTSRPASPNSETSSAILIVDDSSINRKILERLLRKCGWPHGPLIHCMNGLEAVQATHERVEERRGDPGIRGIFMDLQMPVMDGMEATRRIREMMSEVDWGGGEPREIPIVAVTANAVEEGELVKHGFTALAPKPFLREDAVRILRDLMGVVS
ncbi:hypothetical protein HDU97_006597 [Phlyctochytrium planicorne]|nr:hypothetical protein HDU97_006597 [Phlyctochytrium planicorne]